ncbi:tripartite tricarboxylate transporter TctB family protein [Alkalihalobacillus oceani]|uniref:Tripartite tricarboxylate transporter TctB family protein n=1 Tax=Halalkalibacter oceani TaxID=1653776 RepID=A0A9X2DW27_9BACI|nr:tripartite tricarboxylate transporter TctB family protein [Halalkalibacter oceani]MCM3716500.1 tripartite tricarboxylate transporter TctB family protein [Halalkalibacter oceani]
MSYRLATYLSLLFLVGLGGLFIYTSLQFNEGAGGQVIGPAFFPQLVSGLLIVMCIISAFTTWRKEKTSEDTLTIPQLKYILFTIAALVIFVALWDLFGLFYLFAFLFLFSLFYVYNRTDSKKKRILKAVGLSIAIGLFIYLVFEKLLNVII